MAKDRFRDAMEGGLGTYEWHVGHEDEDPQIRQANLERSALTTGEGFVRQQGAATPTIFKLSGWILTEEQYVKMVEFYNACNGLGSPARTIFWQDISGDEFEVLITEFNPQRVRGRSKESEGRGYNWKYTITMEVIA